MTDKINVLVTGGSGLVGKAMQDALKKDDRLREVFNFIFVSSKEADLTDATQTNSLFIESKPSYVINLAARVGGLYANLIDNDSFYRINIKMNENVLKCANEFKVKKCISCLSTCIFPAKIDYPIDESKIHLGPPHHSNAGYSLAKRQVDLLNKEYNSIRGDTLFSAIIPTNIYGPHDNFKMDQSHVIPGLIYKAYLSCERSLFDGSRDAVLIVCGSGRPLRQFIYSLDLGRLILWTIENYTNKDPLILCTDESEEVSIGHVANIIAQVFSEKFDIKMTVKYDTNFSDGQYKKTASNRKFRQLYPDFKFTPLNVGIQEVVDWFCSSYPDVRK